MVLWLTVIHRHSLLFFFKQYKRKKVKVGTGTKRKGGHSQAQNVIAAVPLAAPDDEFEMEEGEVLTIEEQERALLLDGENDAPIDGGQEAHDEAAVKTLRSRAVVEMAGRGIHIAATDNTQALALFPKVSPILSLQHIVTNNILRLLALQRKFTTAAL